MDSPPLTINQYLLARNTLVTAAFPQGLGALVCGYFQINDTRDLFYCQSKYIGDVNRKYKNINAALLRSYIVGFETPFLYCGKFIHISVAGVSCPVWSGCMSADVQCIQTTISDFDELAIEHEGIMIWVHTPGHSYDTLLDMSKMQRALKIGT